MSIASSGRTVAGGIFTPKLVTTFREGYDADRLRRDFIAGLTVAMVALPLSMAIATASGSTPDRGLITAIIGGFIVSALGGSRFQIGGPAGAFIVLVASIIERHGFDGLVLATAMAGVMLIAIGAFQLGTYIKYIPHPVTIGFTAGIAVIIAASQIVDLLGLHLEGREPAALLPKLVAIWHALPSFEPAALVIAALSMAVILILRRYRPHWPGFLIAIIVASGAAALLASLGFQVATIGSRFGGIPDALPSPHLPAFSLAKMAAVFPDALAIAILGGIESLLSAVVADGLSGRRHRSNCELVAQGFANMGSALFGGICVTGTIARTATNVKSGATSPVSGMIHSVVLLLLMLFAAPLASYIPLASLAAILAIVSWGMAERAEFFGIIKRSRGEATILLAVFFLTIFRDLTEAIAVGVVLGAIFFMHRMASFVAIETHQNLLDKDMPDEIGQAPDFQRPQDDGTVIYKISGPFFFGAAAEIGAVLDRIGDTPRHFVLDLSAVPFIDGTGAHTLVSTIRKMQKDGAAITIAGARPHIRHEMEKYGLNGPVIYFVPDLQSVNGQN
jgi:sulfate permease, SulP family